MLLKGDAGTLGGWSHVGGYGYSFTLRNVASVGLERIVIFVVVVVCDCLWATGGVWLSLLTLGGLRECR